eukprot:4572480-Pleurochrysis_carterae.AAC.2
MWRIRASASCRLSTSAARSASPLFVGSARRDRTARRRHAAARAIRCNTRWQAESRLAAKPTRACRCIKHGRVDARSVDQLGRPAQGLPLRKAVGTQSIKDAPCGSVREISRREQVNTALNCKIECNTSGWGGGHVAPEIEQRRQ